MRVCADRIDFMVFLILMQWPLSEVLAAGSVQWNTKARQDQTLRRILDKRAFLHGCALLRLTDAEGLQVHRRKRVGQRSAGAASTMFRSMSWGVPGAAIDNLAAPPTSVPTTTTENRMKS